MDSILLPPPARSTFNPQRSPAEPLGQSYGQLPSCFAFPNVHKTRDAPNKHQLNSASDKMRPTLPRMHIMKALSIDTSTIDDLSTPESTDVSIGNECTSQFESDPDGQKCATCTSKGTHSNSIQTTKVDTCIPSVSYDPNSAVDEKLLPLLALIVGEKLSSLTVNLDLSASIHEQAKETYSLPDTQALYVLRVWVNQKERKISDLLDALDRTGLKEVVVW